MQILEKRKSIRIVNKKGLHFGHLVSTPNIQINWVEVKEVHDLNHFIYT